ncbi:MAG: NUMOD3 domain-containing DNA-binding protein [Methanobacterium sp.]
MLIDTRNDKKYIGKHNGNKKGYWSSGLIPNRIAKKYGKNIFDRVIIEDNIETVELLNSKEMYYIELYDTFNDGYNSTIGGEGGGHWIYTKTEDEILDIKRKKSEKLKNRIFSDETRKKMSESAKNKILTDEHKKNISEAVKKRGGFPHTEKTKEKLSKIMSGRKNPEHSKFMRENNPKSQMVSIDGVIYKTIKEASELLNISRSSIKYRLNSKNEKFKNWFKIK